MQHSFAEFTDEEGHSHVTFAGAIRHTDTVFQVQGSGNGPIDAFFNAIHGQKMDRFTFIDYKEHAVKQALTPRLWPTSTSRTRTAGTGSA